jgi:hypothetical protein
MCTSLKILVCIQLNIDNELNDLYSPPIIRAYQMKKAEMSGVCGTYCKIHIQFWYANLNKKDRQRDLGRYARTLKINLKEMGWDGKD